MGSQPRAAATSMNAYVSSTPAASTCGKGWNQYHISEMEARATSVNAHVSSTRASSTCAVGALNWLPT
jgi:hypothetical protein